MSRFHIILKVSNVLVYLYFLSATVYNAVGPGPSDEVVNAHLTYISPAHWINLAWTAVHFLLGGFVIYQWFEPAHDGTVHGVGWHFVISTVLNAVWFTLWNTGHLYLSFIAILFTASSVSFVFYNLEKHHPSSNWFDKLFIHAPFSIWHGFITVIATENLFAAFTTVSDDGPDNLHIILAVAGIFFLASTAIGYVEYKHKRGDVVGALVISFSLYAIYDYQTNDYIRYVALGFAILTTLYPVRPYVFKLLGRAPDPATAPLLG